MFRRITILEGRWLSCVMDYLTSLLFEQKWKVSTYRHTGISADTHILWRRSSCSVFLFLSTIDGKLLFIYGDEWRNDFLVWDLDLFEDLGWRLTSFKSLSSCTTYRGIRTLTVLGLTPSTMSDLSQEIVLEHFFSFPTHLLDI